MSHGPVMFSLDGTELTDADRELLCHPAAGGIILFSRNYESPEQVSKLIQNIHQARSPGLLVAVDQEGGRVQRFKAQLTKLPPAASFSRLYHESRDAAKQAVRDVAWLMASELRTLGVDFSFAPVLDIDFGCSTVIGDRSFGNTPAMVADLAMSWEMGAKEAGMPSVGKHFPGHGGVSADSHLELPVDTRSLEAIEAEDLYPFRRLIENGLEGIMPAHVIYDQVDPQPAGFSEYWITRILRQAYRFPGVVFSDDLSMAAAEIAGCYADRAKQALAAGCDMVLVCNNTEATIEVLDALVDHIDPVAQSRIARMHGKQAISSAELKENLRWHRTLALIAEIEKDTDLSLAF